MHGKIVYDKIQYKYIFILNYSVLFPGGSTYFNQSHGYADAGEVIYKFVF